MTAPSAKKSPNARPTVSVCIGIYNGLPYLERTIQDVLGQTYPDFELILSDNGSTDGTAELCARYAKLDARVRHMRYETTIPGPANFNRAFGLGTGRYHRWQAADDRMDPRLLERCVAVLDSDPSVDYVSTHAAVIDAQDQRVEVQHVYPDCTPPDPVTRFRAYALFPYRREQAHDFFALMRRASMAHTELEGEYASGDTVFIARLALIGRFERLPEPLFWSRRHEASSSIASEHKPVIRTRLGRYIGTGPMPPAPWWNQKYKTGIHFPEWKILWELSRCRLFVRRSLTLMQTVRFWGVIGEYALRNAYKLVRDGIIAAEHLALGRV